MARQIPGWDEYYLNICKVVASRSKDVNTQIGCVIIGPNREIRRRSSVSQEVCEFRR